MTAIRGYEVQLWDSQADVVHKYQIPLNSCYPAGGNRPNKSVAVVRAREAHIDTHPQQTDLKVLSVVEWT